MARDGAELIDRLERRLDHAYRLARAILLDGIDAEDAVQDACLAAWRRRSSLRDPERFDAWLDRIVINVCRDRLRMRQRERVRAAAVRATKEIAAADASPSVGANPLAARLDDAIAALDLDHRLVVLLRYWLDLPLNEIADRLQIPVGTVKSRLHVALQRMRSHMESLDG